MIVIDLTLRSHPVTNTYIGKLDMRRTNICLEKRITYGPTDLMPVLQLTVKTGLRSGIKSYSQVGSCFKKRIKTIVTKKST